MQNASKVCFLDIDGVLADFWTTSAKCIGIASAENYSYVSPADYFFWRSLGYSDNEFWRVIDATPGFWESLTPTEDGRAIYETCEILFPGRVYLLTAPPLNPEAFAGKARWVREHYPELYRKLFIGPAKEAFAHPGAVLVDDSDANCDKFRAAGGKAVLVPRRWNAGHGAEDTLADVRRGLLRVTAGNE